jgi:hypothetical protein
MAASFLLVWEDQMLNPLVGCSTRWNYMATKATIIARKTTTLRQRKLGVKYGKSTVTITNVPSDL